MFDLKTKTGWLRVIAILEGLSYLALFITMPLKYMYEMPRPNYIVGMAHGMLFMLYIVLVLWVGTSQKWKWNTILWALVASVIPFGTFVADYKIFKPKEMEDVSLLK